MGLGLGEQAVGAVQAFVEHHAPLQVVHQGTLNVEFGDVLRQQFGEAFTKS